MSDVVRVGVCEDDVAIRRVLLEGLRHAGHDPVPAYDGGEALRRFRDDHTLDVLVLDIGLPDADGRDVCRALRAAGQHAPVLFLTALDGTHDLVSGFHAGGDDYVAKPFDLAEVLVRVEALARRHRPAPDPVGRSRFVLDPARHAIVTDAATVVLSPTEFRLLGALTARPGEVVRRAALVAAAWPDGAIVSENTLDSYVRRVRAKLAEAGVAEAISTVRGVGLVLE